MYTRRITCERYYVFIMLSRRCAKRAAVIYFDSPFLLSWEPFMCIETCIVVISIVPTYTRCTYTIRKPLNTTLNYGVAVTTATHICDSHGTFINGNIAMGDQPTLSTLTRGVRQVIWNCITRPKIRPCRWEPVSAVKLSFIPNAYWMNARCIRAFSQLTSSTLIAA